jgi:hypothetical protein
MRREKVIVFSWGVGSFFSSKRYRVSWQFSGDGRAWKIRVCGAAFLGNGLMKKYQGSFGDRDARKSFDG